MLKCLKCSKNLTRRTRVINDKWQQEKCIAHLEQTKAFFIYWNFHLGTLNLNHILFARK